MTLDNQLKNNWQKFFKVANELNAQRAWKKIPEEELFAVKNPVDGVLSYVTVLGPDMDVDGFLAYRGPHGFMTLAMLRMGELDQDEEGYILSQDALMVTFEKGADLDDFCDEEEIKLFEELTGAPIQADKIYPLPRSFVPGYLPYKVNAQELEFICLLCGRLAEIGDRYAKNKKCLKANKKVCGDDNLVLTFVPDRSGEADKWEERWLFPESDIPAKEPIVVSEDDIKELKAKKKDGTWEMVITYSNYQQNGERPYIPMQLVVCEAGKPISLVEDLWEPNNLQAGARDAILKAFKEQETLPATILCPNDAILELYSAFFKKIGIKYKVSDELPTVDEILDEQNEGCGCGDCDECDEDDHCGCSHCHG